MEEREVFDTPCWNFIGGDRQIERILRELPPGQSLIVRNRLAHVLPTAAAIADLGRDHVALQIRVPENALCEPAWSLDDEVAPARFYPELLTRLYGIDCRTAPPEDAEALVIVLSNGDWGEFLARHPDWPQVFALPPETSLTEDLRGCLAEAWSVQHAEGLSGFSQPTIEEAVMERSPARILVLGDDPARVAYTAIGAVDYFIRRAAESEALTPASIRRLGAQVSIVLPDAQTAMPAVPLRALINQHLRGVLGVAETGPDPRARLTAEAIAIDIC